MKDRMEKFIIEGYLHNLFFMLYAELRVLLCKAVYRKAERGYTQDHLIARIIATKDVMKEAGLWDDFCQRYANRVKEVQDNDYVAEYWEKVSEDCEMVYLEEKKDVEEKIKLLRQFVKD